MTKETKRPIAIDLFSGAGGLGLGFEQAGFDIAVAVELDPIHAATHEMNFPYSTTICSDVRKLSGTEIREVAGLGNRTVDAVIGGPPCQGFSLIGQRVLGDPRNELVFHFLRLVQELRPKTFVMENVPGMATGSHTQLLEELIEQFQASGYRVLLPYRLLNAAEYGVPQLRPRVFLVGSRRDVKKLHYPQPITRTPRNGGPDNREFWELPPTPTVAEAISDLPDIDEFEELLATDELNFQLSATSQYAQFLHGDSTDPTDYSYRRVHDPSILTGCKRARHTDLSRERFAATEPGTTEPVSRFFKLAPAGLSNTLRAGTASDRGAFTAPRPIHPEYPRCVSIREAARLHSFPDWFRFHTTIWHGFRQIGNSVPPLLGRSVGTSVIEAIGVRPRQPKTALTPGDPGLARFNMKQAAAFYGVDHKVIPGRLRAKA